MQALSLARLPRQVLGEAPEVLAEALHDGVNLAVWQRTLEPAVAGFVEALVAAGRPLAESLSVAVEPDGELQLPGLARASAQLPGHAAFCADVAWLVQAFGCLLDARLVGVRLLDKAMCPRFHVDRVPLRLVTTYAGPATEWVGEGAMSRARLGDPAAEPREALVRALRAGDVALLKGERWEGNEHGALIHRSPATSAGCRRLLLTLDWLE